MLWRSGAVALWRSGAVARSIRRRLNCASRRPGNARHTSVTRFQQDAELKAICVGCADYAAIHSRVLQEVLARLNKTSQAFVRLGAYGEKRDVPSCGGTQPLARLHLQSSCTRRRGWQSAQRRKGQSMPEYILDTSIVDAGWGHFVAFLACKAA